MSEIEYTHTDDDGDRVQIESCAAVDRALVGVFPKNRTYAGGYVPKAEAPAASLAILQASGWEANPLGNQVEHAVRGLAKYIEKEKEAAEAAALAEARAKELEEATKAAEAEDEAKLEAEAVKLFNSFRAAFGYGPIASLDEIPTARGGWLAAAKTARETTPVVSEEVEEEEAEPLPRYEVKQDSFGAWAILDHECSRRANFGFGESRERYAKSICEDLLRGVYVYLHWSPFRAGDHHKPESRFSVVGWTLRDTTRPGKEASFHGSTVSAQRALEFAVKDPAWASRLSWSPIV